MKQSFNKTYQLDWFFAHALNTTWFRLWLIYVKGNIMYKILFKLSKSLLLFCIFPTQFLYAEENTPQSPHRIVLTNGYFEDTFNSNEGMAYFPMSIYDTYDWTFRKLSVDSSVFSRISSWFVGTALGVYIDGMVGNVPYHEFGHGTRFRSYGNHDIIYYPIGRDDYSLTTKSYFGMVLERAVSAPTGAAATSPGFYASSDNTNANSLIVSAGGMNNEILLSKILSERVYSRGASVPDFIFYLNNKMGPYFYSATDPNEFKGGDPEHIESNYAALGKNITRQDFKNSYLFSTFASGTFYSLLIGNIKYMANGNHNIEAIDIYGFSLPDFYSYINTKGLSTETIAHYRMNDKLSFALSYETITQGDNYNQITPSLEYKFGKVTSLFDEVLLRPDLVFGFGNSSVDIGGSLLADASINNKWGVFAKYTNYNKNNLYGERNINYINNSNEFLFGTYLSLL